MLFVAKTTSHILSVYIYIFKYVYIYIYTYLDLHLAALFSAHSSFRLDLRSFWLFMLTWTRKRAFVSWRTGIIFPGIYAYFPGKYADNFGFKMHKMQTCQKWCNYAHVEENRLKNRNLSNEHRIQVNIWYKYKYIYIYIRIFETRICMYM